MISTVSLAGNWPWIVNDFVQVIYSQFFNVRQLLVWPWFIKYGVSQLTDHWLLLLISCLNADSFFQSYCFCFCTVTISFENPRLELLKHLMSGLVHGFCSAISNYSTSVGSTVQCLWLITVSTLITGHYWRLWSLWLTSVYWLAPVLTLLLRHWTLTPAPVVTVTPSHGPGPSQVSPLSTALTTLSLVVLQQQYSGHINTH